MAFQEQSFTLGSTIPDWFNEQLGRGRAKLQYEDDEVVGAVLNKPTGRVEVKVGDTIVLSKTGLSVRRKEAAKGKATKAVQ